MPDVTPHPKEAQLKPGRKRKYRRIVAGPKAWQVIRSAKLGPCRVCGTTYPPVELHHLVPRSQSGDDVPDNLVPLCSSDHHLVTERRRLELELLAKALTDSEYTYCVMKLGENAMERLFGVNR